MFQPSIPFDGLVGWQFLQDTYDSQFSAFSESPQLKRDTDHFREKIASIQSAEELVADRQLLTVALGAFGLQDDIDNTFFIQKILGDGTSADGAFATQFADSRYSDFSAAFGFGPGEFRLNTLPGFADDVIADYERQSFEIAVGQQSETLRIALNAERAFADLSESQSSETGRWFEIMGQPPMRQLFETALQLPSSFGQIDIDQQAEVFADRSFAVFGTRDPAEFNDQELQENLITRYTALSQINSTSINTDQASIALALLQGSV